MSPEVFADIAAEYLHKLKKILEGIDPGVVDRVVRHLRAARERGSTIYIAGNGGSAATAAHWVNDLCKATKSSGRSPIKAMCLSDNIAWLTALANDEGYERIFAGQLENFADPGDVLVVISASGNSRNLVEAVRFAKTRDVLTIGFLGFDGGALKDQVDDLIWLPTAVGEYGLVETGHSVVADILTTCLIEDRADRDKAG